MRTVCLVDLQKLRHVFGSRDDALVDAVLSSPHLRERLANVAALGFDPARTLREIVADGDIDPAAALQLLDVVVLYLGQPTSFLDETWADDRVLTAIDKAKVDLDRGARSALPWPVAPAANGIPTVSVWTSDDLTLLANDIEDAIGRAPPELREGFSLVSSRVRELAKTRLAVVELNWF